MHTETFDKIQKVTRLTCISVNPSKSFIMLTSRFPPQIRSAFDDHVQQLTATASITWPSQTCTCESQSWLARPDVCQTWCQVSPTVCHPRAGPTLPQSGNIAPARDGSPSLLVAGPNLWDSSLYSSASQPAPSLSHHCLLHVPLPTRQYQQTGATPIPLQDRIDRQDRMGDWIQIVNLKLPDTEPTLDISHTYTTMFNI